MSSSRFPRCEKPCPSCPWRTDQDAGDIPGFSLEKAEGLARTCTDHRGFGPSFDEPVFACHQSKPGQEFACASWLAVEGHAHPNVRLAVAMGRLEVDALSPRKEWPVLHASYTEVIAKLRASVSEQSTNR